jgi:hypothetical protein
MQNITDRKLAELAADEAIGAFSHPRSQPDECRLASRLSRCSHAIQSPGFVEMASVQHRGGWRRDSGAG